MKKVIVYSTSWCPYCYELKDYLRAQNVTYEARDIETEPAARQELERKISTLRVVPVLDIDGQIFEGGLATHKAAIDKALGL
jgi:glutaredoxin